MRACVVRASHSLKLEVRESVWQRGSPVSLLSMRQRTETDGSVVVTPRSNLQGAAVSRAGHPPLLCSTETQQQDCPHPGYARNSPKQHSEHKRALLQVPEIDALTPLTPIIVQHRRCLRAGREENRKRFVGRGATTCTVQQLHSRVSLLCSQSGQTSRICACATEAEKDTEKAAGHAGAVGAADGPCLATRSSTKRRTRGLAEAVALQQPAASTTAHNNSACHAAIARNNREERIIRLFEGDRNY